MKTSFIVWIVIAVVVLFGVIGLTINRSASPSIPSNQINTNSNTPINNQQNPMDQNGNPQSAQPETLKVSISNFAFSPSTITIHQGDTIIWTNMDSTVHTVTSDSGSELGSGTLANGGTYSHTFATTGTYLYHCAFHSGMKATVIVQ